MMNKVRGDLIALAEYGGFDVIVHGCNCFHTMGSGIAGQLARKYPQVPSNDNVYSDYGSWDKLGKYTTAHCKGNNGRTFTVVNAYTQYTYDASKNPVEYSAIRDVFKRIANDFHGLRIAYPMIGCGLAGGEWGIVECIINEALECENHTLVIYEP